MKKNIAILVFIQLANCFAFAQLLHNSVVSSAGTTDSIANQFYLSYTIGEPFIETGDVDSVSFFTQGFQQPISLVLSPINIDSLDVYGKIDCDDSVKVKVVVKTSGGISPYVYQWNLGSTQIVDSSFVNSDTIEVSVAGTYQIRVFDNSGSFVVKNFVVLKDTGCADSLHFYKTVTANGDGINDHWHILGIENYPDNDIRLFNIWGNRVWQAQKYNNTTIVWRGENEQGKTLPPSTYFYVAVVNKKTYKGWVELIY